MHLPDGFLSTPTCLAAGAAATAGIAWAARRTRAEVGDRLVPLTGVMSACVFAAQMVNFPILWGTSGHLLGGVLAAIVLGPAAGLLAISVVLIVQCFLFYDGGPISLGANILNMGLIGAVGGYFVYAGIRRVARGPAAPVIAAVVAAWLSVMAAAAACSVELWVSGTYPLGAVMPAMLIVHSLIGVGEALITGMVVAFLLRVRPDLLYAPEGAQTNPARVRLVTAAGLAVALAIAFFLSPLASASPDGLEHVAENLGSLAAADAPRAAIPMADYQFPGISAAWLATSLAGVIGALAVFVIAWQLSRGLKNSATCAASND